MKCPGQPRIIIFYWIASFFLFLEQSVENIKKFWIFCFVLFCFLSQNFFLSLFLLLENSFWNCWWFVSFDSKGVRVVRAMGGQINRCDNFWFLLETFFLHQTFYRVLASRRPWAVLPAPALASSSCQNEEWWPQRWPWGFHCPSHQEVQHPHFQQGSQFPIQRFPLRLPCSSQNPSPFLVTHTHSLDSPKTLCTIDRTL